MSRPPTDMVPALGAMSPAIMRRHVVLPQPLGPSRETISPAPILSETSSTAVNLP